MLFLFNILFGLLVAFLVFWVAGELGAPRPVAVVISVIAGIIVFLANLATKVIT
jgi:hypothetical protein